MKKLNLIKSAVLVISLLSIMVSCKKEEMTQIEKIIYQDRIIYDTVYLGDSPNPLMGKNWQLNILGVLDASYDYFYFINLNSRGYIKFTTNRVFLDVDKDGIYDKEASLSYVSDNQIYINWFDTNKTTVVRYEHRNSGSYDWAYGTLYIIENDKEVASVKIEAFLK